jgi:hypothetical protein
VNELAQRKRLHAGELGQKTTRAVGGDYLLHPGDVVTVRNAAYTFPAQRGQPRAKRIENGQTAIVESVDPDRDTLTLLVREPGAEPRLLQVDQARLRAEHAAGKRAAAIRLNYALHSFPAQGATVRGTATLAGHWSQAKQETCVGDTRAIYRHSVHVAREDLGTDGTDEDRLHRYAQRISENRQRQASIRHALDRTRQLAVDLPEQRRLAGVHRSAGAMRPSNASREASPSTRAGSPIVGTPDGSLQQARRHGRVEWSLSDPPSTWSVRSGRSPLGASRESGGTGKHAASKPWDYQAAPRRSQVPLRKRRGRISRRRGHRRPRSRQSEGPCTIRS